MKRKGKHPGLKTQTTPRQRRPYIDFDYVHKLNESEKEYLSSFVSEHYGADFDINPTYVYEDGKYVQISGNVDPGKNRDLRKYRNVRKYYLDDEGKFRWARDFKYTDTNLHTTDEQRKSCNQNANANARDLMAIGHPAEVAKEEFQYFLENLQEGMSPEDMMVLREEVQQRMLEEGEEENS
jgi:hypothetical protein